jgi:hypothetical protein
LDPDVLIEVIRAEKIDDRLDGVGEEGDDGGRDAADACRQFLERGRLGFAPNPFTDNDAWVLNFEERIRLFTLRVEGVTGEVQAAPFAILGEVFHHTQDLARYDVDRRVPWSAGSVFCAVVHPDFVGRMDVGYGSEGLGITIGLGYPF